jgi:hypothetical protein
MKVCTIQNSWVGGELGPSLFGRSDIAQYANAAETIENWIIQPSGSLITCPGTEFISECKTGGSTSIARLLQFVFSRTDSYVIEMGVGYFRFFTQGAVVVSLGTTPYEVVHTYTAAQIPQIQYVQINDVVYLCHVAHPIRTLTRMAAANWQLADVTFTGGPFMPDNLTATTITPSATTGSITLSATAAIFAPSGATTGHLNTLWRIGGNKTDSTTGLNVQGYVKITAVTNTSTATATVMKPLSSVSATTNWAEGSWSPLNGWPSSLTFHQQRLFFARTNEEPQTIWGSKSFSYNDFALDGGADDDGLNLQLASNESNDIKWLAAGKSLVAGTYGGEFTVQAGDGGILTPTNASASKQTSWGSEPIVPRKIGNFFYYVQRFAVKLRELFYFWDLDTYKSIDKTILSPHISSGGFIDMAYQQNPGTVLWMVCTNGTIATLTREVDQEIQGWSRQTTDGVYESIATIPSLQGPYDEVWVVVNRTINGSAVRYIERFDTTIVPDRQDQCWYVHSGLNYDAYGETASNPTAVTISLSATAGTSIIVTCNTAYFSAGDIGQRIRAINSSGSTIGELKILNYTSSTIVSGLVNLAFDASSYSAGSWGVSVNDLSGLDHLEGKELVALADGGTTKPNPTVSNGSISLSYDAFYIVIGLPYTMTLKSLVQEAGARNGSAQGKIQKISTIGIKVNRSHLGFKIGGSVDMLDKINFRDPTTFMGTPELLYSGIIPNLSFRDDYRYGSQIMIENTNPLPIEILALVTDLDTNE